MTHGPKHQDWPCNGIYFSDTLGEMKGKSCVYVPAMLHWVGLAIGIPAA